MKQVIRLDIEHGRNVVWYVLILNMVKM